MGALADRLADSLALRKQKDLYRQRLTLQSAQGPVVRIDGHPYLNFCSNDYLGLAAHPRVIAAFRQAALHGEFAFGNGRSELVHDFQASGFAPQQHDDGSGAASLGCGFDLQGRPPRPGQTCVGHPCFKGGALPCAIIRAR